MRNLVNLASKVSKLRKQALGLTYWDSGEKGKKNIGFDVFLFYSSVNKNDYIYTSVQMMM